jgi:hypothetical protein
VGSGETLRNDGMVESGWLVVLLDIGVIVGELEIVVLGKVQLTNKTKHTNARRTVRLTFILLPSRGQHSFILQSYPITAYGKIIRRDHPDTGETREIIQREQSGERKLTKSVINILQTSRIA